MVNFDGILLSIDTTSERGRILVDLVLQAVARDSRFSDQERSRAFSLAAHLGLIPTADDDEAIDVPMEVASV